MAEKRFYWLKLKDNFFDRLDIKAMRMLDDGCETVIIYIKMMLYALNSEGQITYRNILSSCDEEIALAINEDIEKVHKTVEFLIKTGRAVRNDNGGILLTELEEISGSECASAERVRKSRKNKSLQYNENVTADTDIDTEKEKYKKTEDKNTGDCTDKKSDECGNIDYEKIAEQFNEICKSLPKITTLSKTRKKNIDRAYTQLDGKFSELFRKVEKSDFLTGKNGIWTSGFDWIIKPENMIKILEGNYDNRPVTSVKRQSPGGYPPTYSLEEYENQSIIDYP